MKIIDFIAIVIGFVAFQICLNPSIHYQKWAGQAEYIFYACLLYGLGRFWF